MLPIYFSAVLKTEDDKLLEMGQAYVCEMDNALCFTNDFVPLMKIGAVASIVRILGDRELERFCGRVYLSSRNLLQIVDVDEYIMEEARRMFSVNESLNVELYASAKPVHFAYLQKMTYFPGTVRSVSPDIFKICTMEYVETGTFLTFSVEAPSLVLDNFVVRVTERVLLRRAVAVLLCEVWHPSPENVAMIRSYTFHKTLPSGTVGL